MFLWIGLIINKHYLAEVAGLDVCSRRPLSGKEASFGSVSSQRLGSYTSYCFFLFVFFLAVTCSVNHISSVVPVQYAGQYALVCLSKIIALSNSTQAKLCYASCCSKSGNLREFMDHGERALQGLWLVEPRLNFCVSGLYFTSILLF